MSSRLPDPRRVKIHYSYTVPELAKRCRVHKNTVRNWLRQGLPICNRQKPSLIHGRDAHDFLQAKRVKHKRPCRPGQIYCIRCRVPKHPWGDVADYKPISATSGDLIGICPDCELMIYRRVNLARLEQIRARLVIALPQPPERIGDTAVPSVNCDFR